MIATFRPLTWASTGKPGTPAQKRRSRWTFKAPWSATLAQLETELQHLKARDVVIEADFREQDIRLDGMPKANARQPQHPGVRISFESKHGPLQYSTDVYEFWQHNVRAIMLSLEALRAVDRHGVTSTGQQYTGWRAIESGIAMPAQAAMTREQALAELADLAGWTSGITVPDIERVIQQAYRMAALEHHVDRGGKRSNWDRLQAAMDVLGVRR